MTRANVARALMFPALASLALIGGGCGGGEVPATVGADSTGGIAEAATEPNYSVFSVTIGMSLDDATARLAADGWNEFDRQVRSYDLPGDTDVEHIVRIVWHRQVEHASGWDDQLMSVYHTLPVPDGDGSLVHRVNLDSYIAEQKVPLKERLHASLPIDADFVGATLKDLTERYGSPSRKNLGECRSGPMKDSSSVTTYELIYDPVRPGGTMLAATVGDTCRRHLAIELKNERMNSDAYRAFDAYRSRI